MHAVRPGDAPLAVRPSDAPDLALARPAPSRVPVPVRLPPTGTPSRPTGTARTYIGCDKTIKLNKLTRHPPFLLNKPLRDDVRRVRALVGASSRPSVRSRRPRRPRARPLAVSVCLRDPNARCLSSARPRATWELRTSSTAGERSVGGACEMVSVKKQRRSDTQISRIRSSHPMQRSEAMLPTARATS